MAKRTPDVRQNSFGYPAAQQQATGSFTGSTIPPFQLPPKGDKQKWRHEKIIERMTSFGAQNAITGQNAVGGGAAAQAASGSNNTGLGQDILGQQYSPFGPKLGPFG